MEGYMAGELKFVALDLGAESGRSVLGTIKDGKLSLKETHRFVNGGICVGKDIFWDSLGLFSEMKQGLRKTIHQFGGDIAGIGLDTWGVDFALLGPNDVVLENPHHYRDDRTDGVMDAALQIVSRKSVYDATGIQFMQINTLYQLYSIVKNNPWLLDTAERMLMMPDLFNFWFTSVKTNEFTEATTSQMFNPKTGGWAKDIMEKLGIPVKIVGDVIQPGTVIGKLRPSVCEEIAGTQIPFVAPATHDTGSAVAAVPASGEDYAYISSGTWSLMGIETSKPIISDKALEWNFTNEGGVGNTYRFLRNIVGLWLVQECRRFWAREGKEYNYTQITEMAAAAEPFRSVLDTDHSSFLKPGEMPIKIRQFCRNTKQPVPETEGAIIRAALDSLALKYRWVLEGLEMLSGRKLNRIHIIGGGTQNKLLCQLTANTTGRQVIAGPVEATATGNILMQAIGLGYISSIAEARQIVSNSFEPAVYDPKPDARIEDAYEKFKGFVES
jgi:rhamnulokinase